MSRNVLAETARQALSILVWQVGWITAIALICAVVWGERVAWAVLSGGGIGSIWTVYMAITLFKHSASHGARMSALSFMIGWVIKVSLTVSLLVIAFRSRALAPLGLLGGLFSAMFAYWGWLAFRVKHADSVDGK